MEVKCSLMKKDQGVGTVVNNLLYLILGYHMVFKVVLKFKKGVAFRDKTEGRI